MKFVFLCVANSARSQMAEGLARASAPEGAEIFSAGSRPAAVSPHAVHVMAEVDIDISDHTSKGLDDVPLADARVVITLCAEEECPVMPPDVEHRSWAMPDPSRETATPEAALDAFRAARDAINKNVLALWKEFA